jgi:hypothetical protein
VYSIYTVCVFLIIPSVVWKKNIAISNKTKAMEINKDEDNKEKVTIDESCTCDPEQFPVSHQSKPKTISMDMESRRMSDFTERTVTSAAPINIIQTKRRQQLSGSDTPFKQQQTKIVNALSGSIDLSNLQFNRDGTLNMFMPVTAPTNGTRVKQIESGRLASIHSSDASKGKDSDSITPTVNVPTDGPPCGSIEKELPYPTANRTNDSINPSATFSREGMLQEYREDSYRICMTTLENINRKKPNDNSPMAQLHRLSTNTAVRKWRFIVFFVLILCMIVTAVTVYEYMSSRERHEFEVRFRDSTKQEAASLGRSIETTLESMDVLVNHILTFANYTNQTWPFVTMGDFPLHASKTRRRCKAAVLNMYPYVSIQNRLLWEQYTATHNNWVEESIHFQYHSDDYNGGKILPNYTSYDVIHGYEELEKPLDEQGTVGTDRVTPPYYLPMWQSAPVIPTYPPYNWDLASTFANNLSSASLATQSIVFSEVYNIPNSPDDVEIAQTYVDWFKPYVSPDFDTAEPVADIYFPMLKRLNEMNESNYQYFDNEDMEHEDHGTSQYIDHDEYGIPSDFVGVMAVSVFWRDLIQDLLADTEIGLHIIFENPCNPLFTYEVVRVAYELQG